MVKQSEVEQAGPVMSIGALSRASGVPIETLRTWERRYGFPQPERRRSGHRRYRQEIVARLLLVREALALGNRAASVVPASPETLRQLISSSKSQTSDDPDIGDWIAATMALDGSALDRAVWQSWSRLSVLDFIEKCAVPFLREVGARWSQGKAGIMHEHFASERITDFVSRQWRAADAHANGPVVVCATLPGEAHVLPLHLAALVLVLANIRVLFLGGNMPMADVRDCVLQREAAAVLLGSSPSASGTEVAPHLAKLRSDLGSEVDVAVGGLADELLVMGVHKVESFYDLDAWARTL